MPACPGKLRVELSFLRGEGTGHGLYPGTEGCLLKQLLRERMKELQGEGSLESGDGSLGSGRKAAQMGGVSSRQIACCPDLDPCRKHPSICRPFPDGKGSHRSGRSLCVQPRSREEGKPNAALRARREGPGDASRCAAGCSASLPSTKKKLMPEGKDAEQALPKKGAPSMSGPGG